MSKEIVRIETVQEGKHYGEYKLYFLDELYCIYHCGKESIEKEANKRQRAYDLIPDGCKVIPKSKIKEYEGKLVGGVMEDSIIRVFGIATDDGIRGYACSVYFIPSEEYFKSVIPDDNGLEVKA